MANKTYQIEPDKTLRFVVEGVQLKLYAPEEFINFYNGTEINNESELIIKQNQQ